MTKAGIKGRDRLAHHTDTMVYNYLSLPLIRFLAQHFSIGLGETKLDEMKNASARFSYKT